MYFTLDNGTTIRLDKNHVIEMKIQKSNVHDKAEVRNVGNTSATFNDFLTKGINSVGQSHYFEYDSRNRNCQDFVRINLRANGLLTSELDTFIFQDPEKIYKNLGLLGAVNKVITDVAAKVDTVIYGEGKACKCHK